MSFFRQEGFYVVGLSANPLKVVVREARSSDKAPLMEFVSKTWGGHDYIPSVWDDWLKDKSGRMFVVEVDGRLVGMNRVRFQPEGVGWLEGVRIHPDFRGQRLANLLGRQSMEYGRSRGVTTYRLTTGSRNKAARKQIERMGLRQFAGFRVFDVPKKTKFRAHRGIRAVGEREAERIYGFVKASREYTLAKQLCWSAFSAEELSKRAFTGLVGKGCVFTAGSGNEKAVAVFEQVSEGEERMHQVGFLCGRSRPAKRLVAHLFRAAQLSKAEDNYIFLPKGSTLVRALKTLGLGRTFQMLVYEGHPA